MSEPSGDPETGRRWEPGRGWQGGDWGPGRWGAGGHRPRRRMGAGFIGCAVVALVLLVAVATLATWVAAAVLGFLAPGAAPSTVTAVAVLVVIVVAMLVAARIFGTSVRPLAEIAEATQRLADGEPGVRVDPRGPRPVRRLGTSFNTMAERLDRSRDDRRAMLADVTHELRTPLTVIQGGLEAIVDGVHPADQDHLAPLLAETGVMTRLLDDLRTLSLADAGALTLYREPADLVAIARDGVAAQSGAAAAKGVVLRTEGDERLVASVDPVRVREIVANLVANAVRHTPAGGEVVVEVRETADAAVLTVRDTGEGIGADDLARIWDRYQRRADTGGSGLGLAIVKGLAEAHGGTVAATSDGEPGRGSEFRVTLPRRD